MEQPLLVLEIVELLAELLVVLLEKAEPLLLLLIFLGDLMLF